MNDVWLGVHKYRSSTGTFLLKWCERLLHIPVKLQRPAAKVPRSSYSVAVLQLPSRCAVVAAVLSMSLGLAGSAKAQTAIASIETATLAQWKFLDVVSDFPGAKGSLSSVPGHTGSSARLSYDFSAGGKYVGATFVLPSPVQASAVSLWVRSPLETAALLQLEDASGQTLEYQLKRPLEASFDAEAWHRVVVDVAAPSQYFNGKNDGIPHPPFSRIAVLAVPESGSTGWVDFDDITGLDGFRVKLDPGASPLMAAAPGSAELGSRLAINLHAILDERELDIARDAGFSTVRLDLGWSSVERTPGVYDFSQFDALIPALAARGMRLHLIVDYANDLYPALDSQQFRTTTLPAFAAVARAFAKRFVGHNISYEIWNEPNTERFWPVSAGPSGFAALCTAAAVALHQGDPSAKVSLGGLAGFDYDFLSAILADGAGQGADAIGVHPYRKEGGESVGYDLLRLRTFVSNQASPAPVIWSTEWGYSSTWEGDGHGAAERTRQAQLVARATLSSWAVGLPLIAVYSLRDDGSDPTNAEHNFGLIQSDYTEKPALVAVRTLSRLARGRPLAGLLDTGFSRLHGMKFNGPSDTVIALWSEYVGRPISVELPPDATAVSFLGEPRALAHTASGQELTLQESDGPVYVTWTPPHIDSPFGDGAAGDATMGGASSDSMLEGSSGNSGAGPVHAGGTTAATGGASTQSLAGDGGLDASSSAVSNPDSGCACALGAPMNWEMSSARGVATVCLASLIWIRRRRRAKVGVFASNGGGRS